MAERRLSLPRSGYSLDEQTLKQQEEELRKKHLEVEKRKEEAEKKAKEKRIGRQGGTPLQRTPPGRSQSLDKGRKRTTSSPADPQHEVQEVKKSKEEEGEEDETIDDELQENQDDLLQRYSKQLDEVDRIFSKLKSEREQRKKIKLKFVSYLMEISTLNGRLAEQQDANESLKALVLKERKAHKEEINMTTKELQNPRNHTVY